MIILKQSVPALGFRGFRGLGEAVLPPAPGFVDGLLAWKSPSAAVSALSATVQGGDLAAKAGYLGGLVAAPAGLLLLASTFLGGGGRRRR